MTVTANAVQGTALPSESDVTPAVLIERAKATGQARADLTPTDIPFIALMLSTATEYAAQTRPEIWRRYLTLLIDGMCASRHATTPLPVAALAADEMEITMRQRIRGGRV